MFNRNFVKKATGTFAAAFIASLVLALPDVLTNGDFSRDVLVSLVVASAAFSIRLIQPFFSPFLTLAGEKLLSSGDSDESR